MYWNQYDLDFNTLLLSDVSLVKLINWHLIKSNTNYFSYQFIADN